jgi:hypothetical protein
MRQALLHALQPSVTALLLAASLVVIVLTAGGCDKTIHEARSPLQTDGTQTVSHEGGAMDKPACCR